MGLSVLYLINVPFLSWDGPIFTLRGEPHHRHAPLNIVTFSDGGKRKSTTQIPEPLHDIYILYKEY